MRSEFVALSKVCKPEWSMVRDVAELLLEQHKELPTCNFDSLCRSVKLWGKPVDPLKIANYLGGNAVPLAKTRHQIVEWCKLQIDALREREQHTLPADPKSASRAISGHSLQMTAD